MIIFSICTQETLTTSLTLSNTSVAAGVPFLSIPGGFPESTADSPNHDQYRQWRSFELPRYLDLPIPSSSDTSYPAVPTSLPPVKIRLKEVQPLHLEQFKRQLRREQAKASASTVQRVRERAQLTIEAARNATARQRANEVSAWERRAAEYERRLASLQEQSAMHAAASAELQLMLAARADELANLHLNLQRKDATIQEIQAQSRNLGVKLDAVQVELRMEREAFHLELRRERETAAAEREREMLILEERMKRIATVSLRFIHLIHWNYHVNQCVIEHKRRS